MDNYKSNKKEKRNIFVIVILLFAIISSCTVGFFLGRSGENPVDTIYLKEPQKAVSFNVEGHALYTDGTPVKNSNLELHSKVIKSSTDENGYFLAEEVSPGDHTIFLFDENGQVLASCSFTLNLDSAIDGINVERRSDGNTLINTTVEISSLQVLIEVGNDGKLSLYPHMLLKTTDGTRITSDGVTIKPDGTVLMPDGSVIDIDGILTLADGTKHKIGDGDYKTDSGMVILKDGSIITDSHSFVIGKNNSVSIIGSNEYQVAEGITINNNKEVVLPDGSVVKPSGQGLGQEDNTSDASGQTNTNSSADTSSSTSSSSPGSDFGSSLPSRPSFGSGSSSPSSSNSSSSSSSDTSSDPAEPPKEGSIWFQQASLKIFTNSSYSTGTTVKDGVMVISPGSRGIYEFRINSDEQRNINFMMNISKSSSSPELPMFFRITDSSGNYLVGDDTTWVTMEQLSQTQMSDRIGPSQSNLYRLEWSWVTQSDSSDTTFGTDYAGSDYTVDVTLKASLEG